MGRKKNPLGYRLKYYCYMLNVADEARIAPIGYQLQKALDLLPKSSNQKPKARDTKWDKYFYYPNGKTPSEQALKQIQEKYPRSTYILELPLWQLLEKEQAPVSFYIDFLLKMPANIKKLIFSKANPYKLKDSLSILTTRSILRMGDYHALGCLLALSKVEDFDKIHLSCAMKERQIIQLLMLCCQGSPFQRVASELFEIVIQYQLEHYEKLSENDLISMQSMFVTHTENLAYAESLLRPLTLYITNHQRAELMYWLIQSNDLEVLADIEKYYTDKPLTTGGQGLLWVIERLSYKARGLMKTRLEFLYHELQKP